ncbi:MAG TPA: hypothetical protein VLC08_14405 [Chitinolyticbacter sp.]|nr:hypothetical protein [Chitinolyticbacter sp.]
MMARCTGLALLLLLSGHAAAEYDPWQHYDKTLKTLPKDAAAALDRGVTCNHFAGEFNGDGSQEDKERNREMAKLRCDTVDSDISRIKQRYKNQPKVLQAIRTYYEE